MKNTVLFVHVASVFLVFSCGQRDVELPEPDSFQGACGDWYPGGDDAPYGFAKGSHLPCIEWGSVRRGPAQDPTESYINFGELNTWYRHGELNELKEKYGDGLVDPRAVIIAISQEECLPCGELLGGISDSADYFFENGVILVGVCGRTVDYSQIDAAESDQVLINDDDWREDLPRTHDPEAHLPEFSSFPQIYVATLFDMKIIHDFDDAGLMTPEEIIESIEEAIENGGSDSDTDVDTDADSDTDTDTDTETSADPDCSECTAPVCIESIEGRVLFENNNPYSGSLIICHNEEDNGEFGTCEFVTADETGAFIMYPDPDECGEFDFDTTHFIHLTLVADEETWANYTVAYTPTSSEVIDYVFDSGVQYLFELPEAAATYTAEQGATVDHSGVSFELGPGEMGSLNTPITIYEFPTDQWQPPFLEGAPEVDILYYMAPETDFVDPTDPYTTPYFVEIGFDPANLESFENEGDEGALYMLAHHQLDCGDGELEESEFQICDDSVVLTGGLVRASIPRLGWVGLRGGK